MDRDEIIESIKIELGYPAVKIHLGDREINKLIDKCLRKAGSKASPTFLVSRPVVSGMVDLSDLDADTVKFIYLGHEGSSIDEDLFYDGHFQHEFGTKNFYDYLVKVGSVAELRKLAFYDYYFDEGILYVDNYAGNITIEYVKRTLDLEHLPKDWLSWVEAYATALSKIAEGRIRGKFRLTNSPYETNSDELISEGQSEKSELESKFDMMMGYFNIIR